MVRYFVHRIERGERVLKDQLHVAVIRFGNPPPEVYAWRPEFNGAATCRVHARQDTGNRRLATAALTDQRNYLAGVKRQIQRLDRLDGTGLAKQKPLVDRKCLAQRSRLQNRGRAIARPSATRELRSSCASYWRMPAWPRGVSTAGQLGDPPMIGGPLGYRPDRTGGRRLTRAERHGSGVRSARHHLVACVEREGATRREGTSFRQGAEIRWVARDARASASSLRADPERSESGRTVGMERMEDQPLLVGQSPPADRHT